MGIGLAATGPRSSLGVLAWLLQPTGVLAWLLQARCWPGGTGVAAAAHKGYWP